MENINDVKNRIKNKSNKSFKKNEKEVKPNKFKFFAFKFFVVLLVFCFASLACTKDLKLKGSSEVLKKGTKFKNIRLVNGDHNVDCGKIMLKSEFLKKA